MTTTAMDTFSKKSDLEAEQSALERERSELLQARKKFKGVHIESLGCSGILSTFEEARLEQ
eukprot:8217655-Pyramimonas_sp.AAC.1